MSYFEHSISLVPDTTKAIVEQIAALTRELAKHPSEHFETAAALSTMAHQLRTLDTARSASRAIIDLYEGLPWLKSVTLCLGQEENSRTSLEVSNIVGVTEDCLVPDACEFERVLLGRDNGLPALFTGYKGNSIFQGNRPQLYELIDYIGDNNGDTVYLETSRAKVAEYSRNGTDVDGLAAYLFPETWRYLAQDFDLCSPAPDAKPVSDRPRG